MKEILLKIVSDLEDLRANLAVIATYPETLGEHDELKSLAIEGSKKSYDQLRSKIEALS